MSTQRTSSAHRSPVREPPRAQGLRVRSLETSSPELLAVLPHSSADGVQSRRSVMDGQLVAAKRVAALAIRSRGDESRDEVRGRVVAQIPIDHLVVGQNLFLQIERVAAIASCRQPSPASRIRRLPRSSETPRAVCAARCQSANGAARSASSHQSPHPRHDDGSSRSTRSSM